MESRRHRSPSYPAIPIKDAIDRAIVFFKKEGKHKATIATTAAHWGYSAASSGRLTTVAALKSYGLMEDSGEGAARKVYLTPLGLSIVQDERSVSPERDVAIRQAALLPKTMSDLWGKYGTDLPSNDTLSHYLKVERDFNPNAISDVIRIYKDNVVFAGLNDGLGADPDDGLGSSNGEEEDGTPTERPLTTSTKMGVAARPSLAGEEIANIRVSRDCTIRLLATGPYSRKSIEALVAQLKLGLELGTYDDLEAADEE